MRPDTELPSAPAGTVVASAGAPVSPRKSSPSGFAFARDFSVDESWFDDGRADEIAFEGGEREAVIWFVEDDNDGFSSGWDRTPELMAAEVVEISELVMSELVDAHTNAESGRKGSVGV